MLRERRLRRFVPGVAVIAASGVVIVLLDKRRGGSQPLADAL
jgi:hypothetical protein